MDRRNKVILITAAVVLLIGILFVLLHRRRAGGSSPSPAATNESPVGSLPQSGGATIPAAPTEPPPPPPAVVAVRQLAMTFAERYGSFSSEGDFVNIIDLAPIVTERYHRELETFIAGERAKKLSATFSATTTQVIRTDVHMDAKEAHATVQVTTQRTAQGAGSDHTYAQVLDLEALKVSSGGWLVDRAVWEPVRK